MLQNSNAKIKSLMSVNDLEKNDSVYNSDPEITYKKLYKA